MTDQTTAGEQIEEETTEGTFDAARARADLDKETESAGFVDPKGMQNGTQIILRDIQRLEVLFQPREQFEGHVKDLMSALKLHGDLDPILVGWTGARAVLIEGHHRYLAYDRSGYRSKPVAVEWFVGSVNDAVRASIASNSKHKLPMTLQQRLNAAWRLVRLGGFSKAEIVRATAVGDGTIGTMRRILKKHGSEVLGMEVWAKASRHAAGKGMERSEDEMEVWLDQQATIFQEKIRVAVGTKLAVNPQMLARVLSKYCGNNLLSVFIAAKQMGLMDMEALEDAESDF